MFELLQLRALIEDLQKTADPANSSIWTKLNSILSNLGAEQSGTRAAPADTARSSICQATRVPCHCPKCCTAAGSYRQK